MNQQQKYETENIKKVHTKMNETYSTFIQLHSSDLRYMVPWAQYENKISSNIEKNVNNKKFSGSGDKKFIDKIEIISICE